MYSQSPWRCWPPHRSPTTPTQKSSKVTPPSRAHKSDPAVAAESWGCFQISVHSEQTVVCQDAVLLVCVCVCVSPIFTVSSIVWMIKIFVVNLKHCGSSIHVCSPFAKWARGSFVVLLALYVWQGPCLGLATFFAFHSNRHERPALPCKWDDITYRESPHTPPLHRPPCSANPKWPPCVSQATC